MAEAYKFELVSPERLLVSEQVEFVIIPGSEGEMTVMANHAPVMSTVKPGVVTVKLMTGAEQRYVVFGGFVDVLPDACTLLAEFSVPVSDIDKDDLKRRIDLARTEVENAKEDHHRTKAEQFLAHLTELHDTV